MRKAFGLLLIIILSLFKNFVCTQPEVDACYNFYKAGDYRRAIEAGKVAVEKDPNNLKAHYCLGISYYAIGEFKLALEHVKKAESLTSDKKDLMYIYNKIGEIYYRMGYLDEALRYLSRSLRLARDLGDRSMQASVLINIANIYYDKNKLDKALGYYEESLRLTTNEKAKAPVYHNIAGVYGQKGGYQKAVEYYQKAIEIYERYEDYHRASQTKLNLGNTYRKMRDYKKAEKYILEGLEGVKKVGDKYWEATGYKYLGWLHRDKMDKKTAQNYFTRYRDLDWLYKNKRGKNTAEDYLIRAYILYKSIGGEKEAKEVLSDIRELKKER
jgi:tetratricopeptide (TPR) repeat protein